MPRVLPWVKAPRNCSHGLRKPNGRCPSKPKKCSGDRSRVNGKCPKVQRTCKHGRLTSGKCRGKALKSQRRSNSSNSPLNRNWRTKSPASTYSGMTTPRSSSDEDFAPIAPTRASTYSGMTTPRSSDEDFAPMPPALSSSSVTPPLIPVKRAASRSSSHASRTASHYSRSSPRYSTYSSNK
jgi:hypothetical protein